MNLQKIQIAYLNKKHQFILLDNNGLILESSNTIINLSEKYQKSIFEIIPFFESLKDQIKSINKGESLAYNCINMSLDENRKIYDIQFSKSETYITCILEDRTEQYDQWISIQQERNETIIDKEIISKQAQIIKHKNTRINDSIDYARLIQQGVLPKMEYLKTLLPNSLVVFLPKDKVSGDFYWVAEMNNKVFFTPADSTGHGVPGALMSMIGNYLLNDAILVKEISLPNEILFDMRSGIISTLKQNSKKASLFDGLDAALCAWNKKTNVLEYAGANSPLIIIRNSKNPQLSVKDTVSATNKIYLPIFELNGNLLYEIKADKFPVGRYHSDLVNYTNHEIQLYKGDVIYTFSDGYQDQFGGEKDKKFTSKRFKKLLLSIYPEEMEQQKEILIRIHQEWKGEAEQIDDICIIGVKV